MWNGVAALYETAADNARTPEDAVNLLVAVAEIHREQNRLTRVEDIYRRVLGIDPDHAQARKQLEQLYRSESRWIDLAALLEEATNTHRSMNLDADRPALLRELAMLYIEKLSRPHDAIEALERLADISPSDVRLFHDLAQLYCQIGRASLAIQALQRVNNAGDDPKDICAALHHIARIYRDLLELPDRAIDYVRTTRFTLAR